MRGPGRVLKADLKFVDLFRASRAGGGTLPD